VFLLQSVLSIVTSVPAPPCNTYVTPATLRIFLPLGEVTFCDSTRRTGPGAWTTLLTRSGLLTLTWAHQVPSHFRPLTCVRASAGEVLPGPFLLGFQAVAYMSHGAQTLPVLPIWLGPLMLSLHGLIIVVAPIILDSCLLSLFPQRSEAPQRAGTISGLVPALSLAPNLALWVLGMS